MLSKHALDASFRVNSSITDCKVKLVLEVDVATIFIPIWTEGNKSPVIDFVPVRFSMLI